ncbi:MAG TPA: cyanophycinase [Gemmatimonadales bacterium]|jgi:cyanophycinase
MSRLTRLLTAALMTIPSLASGQAPKVGPPRGTVIVVGGGAMGPEVYQAFITAAGGPDALIVDIPTAGGAATYAQDDPSARAWRNAGAHHVVVLHTTDRKIADSDSFPAILASAGGVWFEGGRQFHLVDSYAGTKTEQAFHDVLARGGVTGGSSAGATILGDFLVRGAPSNDNMIMDDPRYEKGFAFLRGVGIDQHVVARERLADLADSIMPKHPELLGMSEDEGTAWVVRGDTATIIGRNKAFAYGGSAHDPGKPFLTLHPGDRYNLGARTVLHRAIDGSPVTAGFVDGLFAKYSNPAAGGATVLVARGGDVLIDRSFGIPDQPKFMPTTTVPLFSIGSISSVFTGLCGQFPPAPAGRGTSDSTGRGRGGAGTPPMTALQSCVARRISTPIGMHKTNATAEGDVRSDVDELYRLALGLERPTTFSRDSTHPFDYAAGWQASRCGGVTCYAAYGTAAGKRSAFLRVPDRQISVIILTNDNAADAKGIADRIVKRLQPQ